MAARGIEDAREEALPPRSVTSSCQAVSSRMAATLAGVEVRIARTAGRVPVTTEKVNSSVATPNLAR